MIHVGDWRDVLRTLPAESAHCVVTSPPYWGLRDYDVEPGIWGGDPACSHEWGEDVAGGLAHENRNFHDGTQDEVSGSGPLVRVREEAQMRSQFCVRCGAWKGCLGLEPTPALYVEHLVDGFRQVRRVLRGDGTLWLNLGDIYCGSWGSAGHRPEEDGVPGVQREKRTQAIGRPGHPRVRKPPSVQALGSDDLKPKDLVGIPWMVAFALRADGWWLRSDIIWAKPNPMPESVTDRPSKSHEHLFLFAKSEDYFYDAHAIREPGSWDSHGGGVPGPHRKSARTDGGSETLCRPAGAVHGSAPRGRIGEPGWKSAGRPGIAGRNKRDVWVVRTYGFPQAHFATFPPKLIDPCVLAGCPERVCAVCGAPWVRQVETTEVYEEMREGLRGIERDKAREMRTGAANAWGPSRGAIRGGVPEFQDLGSAPTCAHGHDGWPWSPGTVLDPFAGSGTTGVVAARNRREFVGIELSPEYAAMAEERIRIEGAQMRLAL